MIFNIIAFPFVTVRGMMYYRKALKLQAFLDMAEDDGLFLDYCFIHPAI